MEYRTDEQTEPNSDTDKVGRKYRWNSVGWKDVRALGAMKTACCRVVNLYPIRGRSTFWEVELRQSAKIIRPDWSR